MEKMRRKNSIWISLHRVSASIYMAEQHLLMEVIIAVCCCAELHGSEQYLLDFVRLQRCWVPLAPIEKGGYNKLKKDKSTQHLENQKSSFGLSKLRKSKLGNVQSVNSMSRINTYTELASFYSWNWVSTRHVLYFSKHRRYVQNK